MAVNLSPIWGAGTQLFDNSGNVLSGGKIYTYAAGTTSNAVTYTSSNGNTANSNPIVLNSAGRVPYEIWLTDAISYKFVLKDSNDALIGTWDNLLGINSNYLAYTSQQEIQTATAGQTVFNLTTMQYQPATNNLSVFVDGINQYGPGAQYAYIETDSDTVTFTTGLSAGQSVKFTTASLISSAVAESQNVSFRYPAIGAVTQSVEDKLSQCVSVKDFGAVGDGITNDTAAFNKAIAVANTKSGNQYKVLEIPEGTYLITPGALTPLLCDVYGPKAELKAASNALATLLTLGHVATGVSGQSITLMALTGYNFAYGGSDPRYGYGVGFDIPAGQYTSQLKLNIFFIQGFDRGINCDCSSGFHIGTATFNINTLWYCRQGIFSNSGNLQFENNVFNIVYMTYCLFNVYSSSVGSEHNCQNIYNIECLELHTLSNTTGFSLVGANTNQNIFNVASIYYNSNTQWIVVSDNISSGNEFNLPNADYSKLSAANNVFNLNGVGLLNAGNQTRSVVYGPSPAPATGSWSVGDVYKVNNPTSGSPASYVFTSTGWQVSTTVGSSTYTPTITLGTNAAASTAYTAYWTRTANIITVFGQIDVQATASNTITIVELTLPVSSNILVSGNVSGIGSGSDGTVLNTGFFNGDTATDKAKFTVRPASTNNTNYSYNFSYIIN